MALGHEGEIPASSQGFYYSRGDDSGERRGHFVFRVVLRRRNYARGSGTMPAPGQQLGVEVCLQFDSILHAIEKTRRWRGRRVDGVDARLTARRPNLALTPSTRVVSIS